MGNENKWEYDYSSQNRPEGGTGYPNVGSSGMNTANQYNDPQPEARAAEPETADGAGGTTPPVQPVQPQTGEKPPRKKAKITLEIICAMLRGAGTLMKAVFGALRITKIQVRLGVRGEDPAAAARDYGKLQAWLYPTLGVLDHFLFLEFDQLRVLPDFGSAQPTVQDKVSFRVSAQALFIVIAAVRVLYEFWRKKVLDIFI